MANRATKTATTVTKGTTAIKTAVLETWTRRRIADKDHHAPSEDVNKSDDKNDAKNDDSDQGNNGVDSKNSK